MIRSMEWMSDLKVGDPVIVEHGMSYTSKLSKYIGKVVRIGKETITIESPSGTASHKFNTRTGRPVYSGRGGGERQIVEFTQATPEAILEFKTAIRIDKQRRFLRGIDWDKVDGDKLAAIVEILTEENKGAK